MVIKVIISIFLLLIVYSLGSALYYLVSFKARDEVRVVTALTWRVGLSLTLFLLLFIGYGFGWIEPHQL